MLPRVTAITAFCGVVPAAKALMADSLSSKKTGGTGVPEAMAISSTTFNSTRSRRSRVLASTGRPPSERATTSPPPAARRSCTGCRPQ